MTTVDAARLFIGGQFRIAAKTRPVIEAATGSHLGDGANATNAEIDAAVHAARSATDEWSSASPEQRAALLGKFASALRARAESTSTLAEGVSRPTTTHCEENPERMHMRRPSYLFNHSVAETERLVGQAEMLRPITQRLLTCAELRAGMRVLDIGRGPGDVAMLAAELVGPRGRVIGIDHNEEILSTARQRISDLGPVPLLRRVEELALTAFEQMGTERDAGGRLVQLFCEAGLPTPSLFAETVVALGDRYSATSSAAPHRDGSGDSRRGRHRHLD